MHSAQLEADALPSIVLLVDRDAARLTSYTTAFESDGLWVATCTDPREAIDAVYDVRPDLLVTHTFDDVSADLVNTLKGDARTQTLPVILVTDRDPQRVSAASLADLCLQQPVSQEQLLTSSRLLIERSHELRRRSEDTGRRAHVRVLTSADAVSRSAADAIRDCPRCRQSLDWIERGRLLGVEYDYYRWCVNGCGLYCYECQAEKWVKLA